MHLSGGDRSLAASTFKRCPELLTVEVRDRNLAVMALQGLSVGEVHDTVLRAPHLMVRNMAEPTWTARLLAFELLQRHYPQRSFQPADVLRAYPSYLCSGTGLKVACRLAHLRQCGLLAESGDAAIPLAAVLRCRKEGATQFCQKFGLSEEGVASFEAGYEQSRDWQRLLQRWEENAARLRGQLAGANQEATDKQV